MTRTGLGTGLAASLTFALAVGAAQAEELWVVNHGAMNIEIFDTDNNAPLTSVPIDVSDPDGDSVPNPPWDLTFSTAPDAPGTKVFVTQGGLLTVIDVASRLIESTYDVASHPLAPGIDLRGCSASRPRAFDVAVLSASVSVVRTYLHCAGTQSGGGASYVVLDQSILVAGSADPVVAGGSLLTGGTGVDVKVLGGPAGPRYHRAWYSVVRDSPASEALAVAVTKGDELLSPWLVDVGPSIPLFGTATLPDTLQISSPPEGDVPVMPGGASGRLLNLALGRECPLSGDFRAVTVTGPGRFSYTVLAVDHTTNELVAITPESCNETRYGVGQGPVALATLGTVRLEAAFVVNRGSGSLTRVNVDGTAPITLNLISGVTAQPTSAALGGFGTCHVEYDGKTAISGNDVRVDWNGVGCSTATKFDVYCRCIGASIGDPLCPCFCDCEAEDVPPECVCEELGHPNAAPFGPLQIGLLPPVPVEGKNPWKRLGDGIPEEFWDHPGQAIEGDSLAYGVTLEGKGPTP